MLMSSLLRSGATSSMLSTPSRRELAVVPRDIGLDLELRVLARTRPETSLLPLGLEAETAV